MSEYQTLRTLRTNKDLEKLQKVFNNFENPVQIVTMNQAPDISQNGFPDLTLYVSGKEIPKVKIVLHHIFFCKLDNAPVVALELEVKNDFRLLRLWHEYSSDEEKPQTTSWFMADTIEWKCVQEPFA